MARKKSPRFIVLGTEEWEARHVAEACASLGWSPQFINPENPETFVQDHNPDLVAVSREWSVELRLAIADCRRNGIPTVYIMDGVLEWSYLWNNLSYVRPEGTVLQPLLADVVCTLGAHPSRILASLGLAKRTEVVGLPRLDKVERLPMPAGEGNKKVLVVTARTAYHNAEQQVEVRRALSDLREWSAQHEEVEFVWKIAEDLATDLGVIAESRPLTEALRECHAVVTFPSTVILEAMLSGRPVAQMEYRPVPLYVDSAWEIRAQNHIDQTIHGLLYPTAERLAFQEACLDDELSQQGIERLADVLQKALQKEYKVEEERGSGNLDFNQIHNQLSTFAMGPLPRLQYELDAAYQLLNRRQQEKLAALNQLRAAQAERDWLVQENDRLHKAVQQIMLDKAVADSVIERQSREVEQHTNYVNELLGLIREGESKGRGLETIAEMLAALENRIDQVDTHVSQSQESIKDLGSLVSRTDPIFNRILRKLKVIR